MSEIINIGFIGAGDISAMHAAAIAKCAGASLAGLWSIDDRLNEEKAAAFDCKVFPSAKALVEDPGIDALFILTNLETHADFALPAMDAGKHVLIEKPVAASAPELAQLKETARSNGVVLMPGHNYIYEPGIHRTRELLHSGKLGDLVAVYILYHIFHPEEVARRYPGVIRHILTHHAYILLYLAGEPESASAIKSIVHYEEFDQEDIAMVNLKMKNGALVHFSASFAADDNASDPWTFIVKVIGTEGATRFSYRDWVENKPGPVHAHTWSAYQSGIDHEVAHFIRCVEASRESQASPQPLSTIDDAITAFHIVEACERSAREGQSVSI